MVNLKIGENFVLLQDGNKTCFAQSIPVVRAPKKNLKKEPSRLFVSFRPAENIKNEKFVLPMAMNLN
ncbi:MAG: hypothetical protein Ct9H300mP5_2980 [Candidatus Pelagibacterales bacterium]|nr:MAG: hypothetical protein Ct9H300mP5_2980 [Pelagibacterales bacterium]